MNRLIQVTRNETVARVFFGVTSAVVTFGLVLQLVLAWNNDDARFETGPARIVNTLSFFTVQSNILVAITTGMLAFRVFRTSTLFRVLRLSALIAIAITGVVYHLALKGLHELTDKEAVADWVLHTASPLLCVLGWLLFGPRDQVDRRLVGLSVVFPLAWLGYTLVRGAVLKDRFGRDYYPYPFLDVVDNGYLRVVVNIAIVALLFLLIATGALSLDARLPGVSHGENVGGTVV